MAVTVALGGMSLQVGGYLGLQGREQHTACALAGDLVGQGPASLIVSRRLVADHPQQRRPLLPAAEAREAGGCGTA